MWYYIGVLSPKYTYIIQGKGRQKMTNKTTTKKTATPKKQVANAVQISTTNITTSVKIITLDNANKLARIITKAMFKYYTTRYPLPFYEKLRNSLYADMWHIDTPPHIQNTNYMLSDAYDIVQVASIAIMQHLNKPLDLILRFEKKIKKGVSIEKPVTVILDIYKTINRYVMSLRSIKFKQNVNVDDYNGKELQVPCKWDMPTYHDFEHIAAILDKLNLTDRQDKVLTCRMQGLSVNAIAKYIGVSRQSIMKTMKQIQKQLPQHYQEWGNKLAANTKRRELIKRERITQ